MGADGKAPRGRACPPFVLAAFVMSVVMGCFTLFSSSASLSPQRASASAAVENASSTRGGVIVVGVRALLLR